MARAPSIRPRSPLLPPSRPIRSRVLTLAIEASNPSLATSPPSVALGEPGGPITVEPIRPASRHDDDLAAAIDRLFARTATCRQDLRAVAVSIGPGGYTSLRMACATAQMVALALGIPCIPVPTAAVALTSVGAQVTRWPVAVALAGKADAAHVTLFPGPSGYSPSFSGLADAQAFLALGPALLISDEFLPVALADAAGRLGLRVIPTRLESPALLRVSGHFEPVSPEACVPLYGREPEAVTKWRALHAPRTVPDGPSSPS